jgi:hypothetical protein
MMAAKFAGTKRTQKTNQLGESMKKVVIPLLATPVSPFMTFKVVRFIKSLFAVGMVADELLLLQGTVRPT